MFLPMNTKDLWRFFRSCFWEAMYDFIVLSYRPPGMDKLKDSDAWQGFNAVLEDDDCKKKFLKEPKEHGLQIIWFVRCYSCEKDMDVKIILENDQPGQPIVCPDCDGKNIDVILKGVVEA